MKNVYRFFSKPGFLSTNYTMKFLFIAFIGVHIPLIVLIMAIAFHWISLEGWNIIAVALLATLVATAGTLYLLRGLLWPLHEAKKALSDYTGKKIIPTLPLHYTDEAGQLLQQVQLTIDSMDGLLRERKDLLALLSHDLRTAFAQMSHIGALIQTEKNQDTIQHYGLLVHKTATEQLRFIEDMVMILEGGNEENQSHVYESIKIEQVIGLAIDAQHISGLSKQIQVLKHHIPDVSVKCNLRLLSQAISNIIGNAIKFSHRGGEVIIKVHLFSGHIHILIADKGVGFESGKAELIFQKFTSEGQSGTEGEISAGIGLYLTRKIIQNHGGMIAAFSEGINKGAVFTIQLPIAG
ncbi:sensor histidine kinase [Sediminibacterium sp.]|uniref:sensor histidine kinase n=1 Tax=Sediminibacterium sp. TaxID=1917865 RepID=UPI003F72EBA2